MIENHHDILTWLYNNYYDADATPEDLISSHWKLHHGQVKVDFKNKKELNLVGCGFGDLQNKSIVYKICSSLTIFSYICKLSDRKSLLGMMPQAAKVAKKMGMFFSYDCFRQLCSLHLILPELSRLNGTKKRILVIGDGYGYLSALIKEFVPDAKLCLVDLGKTLLFQANYCQIAHPGCAHALVTKDSGPQSWADIDFLYCPVEYLDILNSLSFDVAINIASMQEMNQNTIDKYFNFLRRSMPKDNLFYCCNREEKKMPGGEISRFSDYPWNKDDKHLVDELCPWHRYYMSAGREKNGPRLLDIRIPLINYFEGPHRHRLTVLQPQR